MSIVGFPLLLIPLAIINIIAFLMPGVSLGSALYTLPLPSNASWTITFSDVLIAFAMLLLFFEVAKTARPGGKYLTDHLLSVLLFGAATAEFLLLPQFGNSTFFLLTALTFVDVICGIAIRARQRGFVEAAPRASRKAPAARREPPVEAQPAPKPVSEPAAGGALDLERPAEVPEVSTQFPAHADGHDHATAGPEATGPAGEPPLEPRR